jgi:hypothetical protein
MARACAAQTNATYLKLAGQQLVQVISCLCFSLLSVSNEWFNCTMLDPSKGFVSKLWLLSVIDVYRGWSKAGVGCFSAGQGEGSLHYLY